MILWTCGASGQDWRYPYDGQPIWTALTNHTTPHLHLSAGVAGADSVDLRACASPVTAAQELGAGASDKPPPCRTVPGRRYQRRQRQPAARPAYYGAASQQWLLSPDGSLVNPATDKCADDPLSTTVTGTPLDLYTCNGTGAQEW